MWGYMNWAPCDFVFSLAYSKWEQLLLPSSSSGCTNSSTNDHWYSRRHGMGAGPNGKGRLVVLVMEVWHEWMQTAASPVCSWHGEQANLTYLRSIIQILRGQTQDLHAKAPSYWLTLCWEGLHVGWIRLQNATRVLLLLRRTCDKCQMNDYKAPQCKIKLPNKIKQNQLGRFLQLSHHRRSKQLEGRERGQWFTPT